MDAGTSRGRLRHQCCPQCVHDAGASGEINSLQCAAASRPLLLIFPTGFFRVVKFIHVIITTTTIIIINSSIFRRTLSSLAPQFEQPRAECVADGLYRCFR